MIEKESMPKKSPLISEELEGQLKEVLKRMTQEAAIVCVVQPQDTVSMEMAGMLCHMESLSEKLSCMLFEKEEAQERFQELDTTLLPVSAIYLNGTYTGIAFHGVTGGKELNSLVMALYNTAGAGQKMEKELREKIRALHKSEIKIFVSLACHHCAQQVINCQQIAAQAPEVEARMIDARLYPQLAKEYKIERIPMTVINGEEILLGTKTVEELYTILNKQ